MVCSRVPLYQAMYSATARVATGLGGPGLQVGRFAFDRGEDRFGQVLSQRWPVRPGDEVILQSANGSLSQSRLARWPSCEPVQPRWWVTTGPLWTRRTVVGSRHTCRAARRRCGLT